MLKVTMKATPERSTSSYFPSLIEISRLPSHGVRFGSPPKLQGHEMVQLQLSATVAVRCHLGAAARGGAVSAVSAIVIVTRRVRMAGESLPAGLRMSTERQLLFGFVTGVLLSVASGVVSRGRLKRNRR